MRKINPLFLFILSIIIATFAWENINISFNIEKAYPGDNYYENQHHPQTDTLRFLIFLSIPFSVVIFYYQISEKIFFKNSKRIVFEYENNFYKANTNLIIFFWITFLIIIFEFFFIKFDSLNYHIDIFHEGLWLTASSNFLLNNELWKSSFIYRGFFGNFHPAVLWKITGIETIGIVRFLNLFIILLNKIFLLLISYRISSIVNLKNNEKILFYLLLSSSLLIFTSYIDPVFYLRSFLLFVFIFVLLNFFSLNNQKSINSILIGIISSFSIFWFIDIGLYINFIFLIFLFFLIIRKKMKYFIVTLTSFVFSWILIFFIFPPNEFNEFIINTKLALSTIEYVHGIIFPTPFFSMDARSTKIMVLFLITGYLTILEINTIKKENLKFIITIIILFITSIIYFKYGLSRSDSGHIRIASGFVYIPLLAIIYYKLIVILFKKKIFNDLSNKIAIFLLIIFFSTIFFNKKFENKSSLNLITAMSGINKLIKFNDERFISKDYQNFIEYYKDLSSEDKCVKVFTNEVAIPFLLKKPTCSKYFLMYASTPTVMQKKIIEDLNKNLPNYIIYKSDIDKYGHLSDRLKLLDSYILENYSFYEKFKYWEIYKIKIN